MTGRLARGVPCSCSPQQHAAVYRPHLVSLIRKPFLNRSGLHACRVQAADKSQDSLETLKDAAVLSWSFAESPAAPEGATAPDDAAQTRWAENEQVQPRKQQRQRSKQISQQQQPTSTRQQQQQQGRLQQQPPQRRKHQQGTTIQIESSALVLNERSQSRTPHSTKELSHKDHSSLDAHTPHSQTSKGPLQESGKRTAWRPTDASDPYTQAQQRVRAVLSAADLSNPAAAAEQLQDTIDDLTIALQLLATAPRPNSQDAFKQYNAALQKLAAAVLQKYKQVVLRLVPAPRYTSPAHFSVQQQQHYNLHQQQLQAEQEQQLQQQASHKQLQAHQEQQQQAQQEQLQAPQQQAQQQQQQQLQEQAQQQQLTAGLASLPATRLAAAVFSLGVLRLYDRQLIEGLESASLQLMRRNTFKPNQLGQLVQGFVYLDHKLSTQWHAGFVNSTRRHLDSLQGPQLASLAVWILAYGQGSTHNSSSSTASTGDVLTHILSQPAVETGQQAASVPAIVAGVTGRGLRDLQLDAAWVQGYLASVGRAAGSFKSLQLVQVIQAAAVLAQQQPGPAAAAAAGGGAGQALSSFTPVPLDEGTVLQHAVSFGLARGSRRPNSSSTGDYRQQRRGTDAQHSTLGRSRQPYSNPTGAFSRAGSNSTQHHSSTKAHWVVALVAALHQQLPELTMAHLAAALPAFLSLTHLPWPQRLLQPVLLQVQLLLPSCSGRDLVVVTQAVSHLAGPEALAAQQEWCNAVLVQLHAQLPLLGPAELAGAVHAVALLQVKPYKAWVYDLCQRLRVDARAMDAMQVLVVLEGLAGIGVQLDPEVLHSFVLQIRRFMGRWSGRELGRVAASLRTMYPKVLPGRTVQQLVGELQRRQQFLELQEVPAGGLFQIGA